MKEKILMQYLLNMKKAAGFFLILIAAMWLFSSPVLAAPSYGLQNIDKADGATGTCVASLKISSNPSSVSPKIVQIMNAILAPIISTLQASSTALENGVRNYAVPLLQAVSVLYLVIYGLMITLEMVQVTWSDAFMRIIKVGLIFTAVSSAPFMTDVVRGFFIGGMNELINIYAAATSLNVGCGLTKNASLAIDPNVLCSILTPLNVVFSHNMLIMIMSSVFAGSSGIVVLLFLILGIFVFLMTMLAILMTYLKAIILLFILLGLAPLFFVFLMFQVTRSLFDAWLGMTLSFALQPVLLFAFFGLFTTIMTASIDNIVSDKRMCYGTVWDLGIMDFKWWYFAPWTADGCGPTNLQDKGTSGKCPSEAWIADKDKPWAADGDVQERSPSQRYNDDLNDYAPPLRNVLIFIAVCMLCFRYTEYVEQIARELTGSGGGIGIGSNAGRVGAAAAGLGITDPYNLARDKGPGAAAWAGQKGTQGYGWVRQKLGGGKGGDGGSIEGELNDDIKRSLNKDYSSQIERTMAEIKSLREKGNTPQNAMAIQNKYQQMRTKIGEWKGKDAEGASQHITARLDAYKQMDPAAAAKLDVLQRFASVKSNPTDQA